MVNTPPITIKINNNIIILADDRMTHVTYRPPLSSSPMHLFISDSSPTQLQTKTFRKNKLVLFLPSSVKLNPAGNFVKHVLKINLLVIIMSTVTARMSQTGRIKKSSKLDSVR